MLNNKKNFETLANVVVVAGVKDEEYIESLAQRQDLKTLREYGKISARIKDATAPSKELKENYVKSLFGFLAWDLCFNGHFDGTIEGWSMIACGLIPVEFKEYDFLAEDLARFAKSYVNYYANMVK